MVSNLDTDTINSTIQTVQGNVENQSEDEILDYLMGSKTASMPKELKAVKENVRLNNTKFNIKPKSNEQLEETANAIFNKVAGSLISLFDRLSSSVNKGRNVVSSVDLKPVVSSVKKMHSVELVNIDLTEEQIEFIKAKTQPVRTRLQPVTSKMIKAFDLTFDFIAPKFAPLTEKINLKLPVLKHSFAGVILLIGCAIMAVVSHIAMNVGSQPNEDLLTSRKLAPVNWNVNGQVTEADKVNIKSLLATGQIKVLPKGKKVKANIQLITDTTSIQNKSVSPDTSFMMISSNTVGHTVNYGESVLSISQKYKVSISDLISSNPDADLVNLKPGDSIEIPNVLETSSESQRPSRIYSKMPRNLLASRSMSGLSRANSFNTVGSGTMMWPVPSSNTISSKYGPRWGGFHPGIDITAPIGTPIIATKDGVVISSGWEGGYGKCVIVDHGNGVSTRYAHASSLLVKAGQPVKAGQMVAKMGSTGWSTGSHLHYEVMLNSRHSNPMRYF